MLFLKCQLSGVEHIINKQRKQTQLKLIKENKIPFRKLHVDYILERGIRSSVSFQTQIRIQTKFGFSTKA